MCRRDGEDGLGMPEELDAAPPLTVSFVGPKRERRPAGRWTEATRDIEVVLPASSREGPRNGIVTPEPALTKVLAQLEDIR